MLYFYEFWFVSERVLTFCDVQSGSELETRRTGDIPFDFALRFLKVAELLSTLSVVFTT